jgi:hypothetical protein
MELQGRPGDNTTAGLHNVLPDIECIVENLTEALQKYQHASPQTIEGEWHFATQIKLALDKAQDYYAKLDDSSAYLAATVLQPAKGWKFVEGLWRTQSTWLADAKTHSWICGPRTSNNLYQKPCHRRRNLNAN